MPQSVDPDAAFQGTITDMEETNRCPSDGLRRP
jgi:hypothetical protein